jgi:calcium-dependent protein kinase
MELIHHCAASRRPPALQVASFMRAVLRTLAQCHSHHILHRDIKVGRLHALG